MTLAKSGISRDSVLAGALDMRRNAGSGGLGRQLVQDAVERRDGEVLVEGVVDLDHRRLAAGREALRGFECELAVAAGLTSLAAEALLHVPLQLAGVLELAR